MTATRRGFLRAAVASAAGVCISSLQRPARGAKPPKQMNVLFLIVDDLNTWLLTDPNRYTGKVIAPNIRRLAQEGVLFHNAYTASPLCVPSRTAFLSGVAPWKSGVYQNQASVEESQALKGAASMFKTFQDNGYFTARLGKVSHGYDIGVKCDVHMKHSRTPRPPGAPLNTIGGRTERDWGPTHLDESVMSDTRLADKTIELLQQRHDKPFFIACGLFHPHYPWYAPRKYFDMYPLDEIKLPPVKDNDLSDTPVPARKLVKTPWDQKVKSSGQVKKAIQGYLASVSFSDANMGRVLEALKKSPYRDNTMVVLLSDHGFHLGEKQQWTKGTLWEEATDSVLMFRVPGLTKPGQVCRRPVSLLDIYPTLVDVMGFGKLDHLDGRTLLPQLKDPKAPRAEPAIMALSGHISVRTEDFRYTRYTDGSTELYDRRKDPNEWVNQANNPKYAGIKAKLDAHLPAPEDMAKPVRNPRKNPTADERKRNNKRKAPKKRKGRNPGDPVILEGKKHDS